MVVRQLKNCGTENSKAFKKDYPDAHEDLWTLQSPTNLLFITVLLLRFISDPGLSYFYLTKGVESILTNSFAASVQVTPAQRQRLYMRAAQKRPSE